MITKRKKSQQKQVVNNHPTNRFDQPTNWKAIKTQLLQRAIQKRLRINSNVPELS
ncbi:MAG: hypothetical protein R2753_00480 [Chitinophagales bacterium]